MNWLSLLSTSRLGDGPKFKAQDSNRSEFEADYDRIIFSRPFRNLQDKTQVFPLPDQDFVHTRLTHSLEVSSVGRSLGKNVGAMLITKYDELASYSPGDFGAIVGAAALAHDVGNPPFGHSGESAISDFFKFNEDAQAIKTLVSEEEWADLTDFEGNAQGFRLLTRNQRQGLKLTYSTLAAFTKYPCPSKFDRTPDRKSQKKYGYFRAESEMFSEMAEALGLVQVQEGRIWARHPLAFLVEAADDICYHIIDLEDGFGLGLLSYTEAREFLAPILGDRYQPDKLEKIPSDKEKIGVLRAVAIHVLIDQCTEVFMAHEEDILAGEFDTALTDMIPAAGHLEAISKFSVKHIYQCRQVLEKEAAGFEVIDGVLQAMVRAVYLKFDQKDLYSNKAKSVWRLLPDDIQYKLEHDAFNTYERMLLITDYVSGLTDSSAIKLYRIIKGINLS